MDLDTKVMLIDADARRRAAISHSMAGSGVHIEPLETVDEVSHRWPQAGVLLVHDHAQAVLQVVDLALHNARWLPVIAFAEQPAAARIVETVIAGAVDYLEWPFGLADLAASLAKAGERASTLGSQRLRAASARGRVKRLTRRERQVLAAMATGLSNRTIAEQLAISPRTVEIHRANLLNKMQAGHTSEAIRLAIEADLVA